jgi:hypothetical protein
LRGLNPTVAMFFVTMLALAAPSVAAPDTPIGHVIVARSSGAALVIWDASPEVASMVSQHVDDAAAARRLGGDALRVLVASLEKVSSAAESLTVRVVYNRTGDVSPVYGAATFAGVERYAEITADMKSLVEDRDHWKELVPSAPLPSWFAVKITGKLPPR